MEEFAVEAKSKVSNGLQISETNKSLPELQSPMLPRFSDVSKFTKRYIANEEILGQNKGKVSEDFMTKETFRSPVELTEMVAVFPALSEIENAPEAAPIPPFREERVVSVFNFGLRSVVKTWEPGILKSTFKLSAILTLKLSVLPK